jgi:hypothetical protein
MKIIHHLLISLAVIAFMLLSCQKETYQLPDDQPVYFEYKYQNFAWGYQHHGWLIDNEGKVRYYSMPEEWRIAEVDGISKENLLFNLSQTDSIITQIDKKVLDEKLSLIPKAKDGEITTPENHMFDAGTASLYAYYYDRSTKKYKGVLLAQSGDWECHNTSEAAVQLVEWMKENEMYWFE